MPYEEGLAYYRLGRHCASAQGERERQLKQAAQIFARLGAKGDLGRVNDALTYPDHIIRPES
jgi:hypothetical protein